MAVTAENNIGAFDALSDIDEIALGYAISVLRPTFVNERNDEVCASSFCINNRFVNACDRVGDCNSFLCASSICVIKVAWEDNFWSLFSVCTDDTNLDISTFNDYEALC